MLWLWCRPGGYSSDWTPSLGTCICRGSGPRKGKKTKKKEKNPTEFPLWLSQSRTQHSAHEDVGSIPGLDQWVEDPALPQAVVEVTDAAWILRGRGCACGFRCSSKSTPRLGTSMWHRCGPKTKKPTKPHEVQGGAGQFYFRCPIGQSKSPGQQDPRGGT